MSFMERHTKDFSHLNARSAASRTATRLNILRRDLESIIVVSLLTGLAVGAFVGWCVVGMVRR
jgi:hypothetical protein